MDNEIIKIALPIATFVLGGIFSLWLQLFLKKRDQTTIAAKEIARLTKDWYNQIHEVVVTYQTREDSIRVSTNKVEILDYVHNRVILPDLLFHFEILKKNRKGSQLVEDVESFLKKVTYYEPANEVASDPVSSSPNLFECRPVDSFFGQDAIDVSSILSPHPPNPAARLGELDALVQSISRKAGALVS